MNISSIRTLHDQYVLHSAVALDRANNRGSAHFCPFQKNFLLLFTREGRGSKSIFIHCFLRSLPDPFLPHGFSVLLSHTLRASPPSLFCKYTTPQAVPISCFFSFTHLFKSSILASSFPHVFPTLSQTSITHFIDIYYHPDLHCSSCTYQKRLSYYHVPLIPILTSKSLGPQLPHDYKDMGRTQEGQKHQNSKKHCTHFNRQSLESLTNSTLSVMDPITEGRSKKDFKLFEVAIVQGVLHILHGQAPQVFPAPVIINQHRNSLPTFLH